MCICFSVASNSYDLVRLAVNLIVGLDIVLIVIVLDCMLSKIEYLTPYER